VINIASIDGISVNPWETYSYAASKAGLIHLTRRMALRLAQDNIVMSGIAPGPFASEMNKDGARPWRRGGAARAGRPHRPGRGHGRRGDLPGFARRRLRGGRDDDGRRRRDARRG
jgi:NAD(P)-dependent dehydrogenase (short-subunit alcohol dehydrogenase family)